MKTIFANNKRQILQVGMLAVVLAGVGVGVYLFRNFQSRTDKAASVSYVTCIAPSSCMAAGSCYRQGGTTNGSCSASGDVCCSLPVPAKAYPDFSTQGASTSVVADNCCNRSDYKSCSGANQQETVKNFTDGYYACQNAQCGACQYKKETVTIVDGIKTSFYADTTQTKLFGTQLSTQLNFNAGSGAPLTGMPTDNFSIVGEGYITATNSDDYFIQAEADNTIRVWVDDKLIIDRFGSSPVAIVKGETYLQSGVNHRIKVLYSHATGTSKLVLTYAPAYSSSTYQPLALKVEDTPASRVSSIMQGNFTNITAGESVSGTRSVAFTADPSTTSSVVFQLVGKNISFVDYSSPYNFGEGGSYNFGSLPAGSYTLEAEAQSNIMKGAYKKSINFNIASVTPTATPAPSKVEVQANADTYVDSANSSKNYGTVNTLGSDGSPVKIAYFKFDLSKYKGLTLNKATLNLHVKDLSDAGSTGTHNVKTTTSSWSETGLTYSTRPTLGSTNITSFAKPARNTWLRGDITSSVKAALGTSYSIAVTTTSSDGLDIDSREATAKPSLTLEFATTVLGTSDSNDRFTDLNEGDEISSILFTGYEADATSVSTIEYYVDETFVSAERVAPFVINAGNGYDISNINEGEHTLKVVAKDEDGSVMYEDSIKFNVKKQDKKGNNFFEYLRGLFSN